VIRAVILPLLQFGRAHHSSSLLRKDFVVLQLILVVGQIFAAEMLNIMTVDVRANSQRHPPFQ
jgi:hypothetical protein